MIRRIASTTQSLHNNWLNPWFNIAAFLVRALRVDVILIPCLVGPTRAYSQPSWGLQITKMSKISCLMPEICDDQNGNGSAAENPKSLPRVQNPLLLPRSFLEGWVMKAPNVFPCIRGISLSGHSRWNPSSSQQSQCSAKFEGWSQKSGGPIFGLRIRSTVV
jgi:hypothetical protein